MCYMCVHWGLRACKGNTLKFQVIAYSRLSLSGYKGGSHFAEKGEKEVKRVQKGTFSQNQV